MRAISGLLMLSAVFAQQSSDRKHETLDLSYALQLLDADGRTQTVKEDTSLRSGEALALLVKTTSPMYLYVFNRGRGEQEYRRLFPAAGQVSKVGAAWESPIRLPQDKEAWLRLDK